MKAKWWVWGWLLLGGQVAWAQSAFTEEEASFLFSVKQVDEFFERFNHEENTLLRQHLGRMFPDREITRQEMIKGLFNYADRNWDLQDISAFLAQVSQPEQPVLLSFYDRDWYAELDCAVIYEGQPQQARLTMRVERLPGSSATKWVLAAAAAEFLELPRNADPTQSLSPASHGTDFMNLDRALEDGMNVRSYLPQNYRADVLTLFLKAHADGKLEFRQVNQVTYHFLQVDGWIFTLRNYNRSSRNSGWLISQLLPADTLAKTKYRSFKLHLPD